jgi:transposase InsO family protein
VDLHANAALSWSGRRELARRVVEDGWTLTAAAEAAGVSVRCARRWVGRYRGGDRQPLDRSSAPRRIANQTPNGGWQRRSFAHGWEYVHVAVDDYSRLAYAEILDDEKAATAAGFLRRAVAFYARHGIRVERVLSDNGACYRATVHALACRSLGIRHLRTRPYRPKTNGKAERFIRTLLNGWAYATLYRSSNERSNALDGWLWHYNHRRRHAALGHQPPISRTNLLRSYI